MEYRTTVLHAPASSIARWCQIALAATRLDDGALAKTRLRLPGGATPCGHEFLHLRGCFRPTKWQGNRGGGIKEIEPAEPNHASDACIAALRAPHGADFASRPGARAGAGAFHG